MANEYVHGIRVVKGAEELRIVKIPSQSVVGIVGTAPRARFPIETPTAFYSGKEALDGVYPASSTGERGTLYQAVRGITAQGAETLVLIRAKSDSQGDVLSAIRKFLDAEALTGLKPKVLCAPGHTGSLPKATTPSSPATPVAPVNPNPRKAE